MFVTRDTSISLPTVPPKPRNPILAKPAMGGMVRAILSSRCSQSPCRPAPLTHEERGWGVMVRTTHIRSLLSFSLSLHAIHCSSRSITQRSLEQTRTCYMLAMPLARARRGARPATRWSASHDAGGVCQYPTRFPGGFRTVTHKSSLCGLVCAHRDRSEKKSSQINRVIPMVWRGSGWFLPEPGGRRSGPRASARAPSASANRHLAW